LSPETKGAAFVSNARRCTLTEIHEMNTSTRLVLIALASMSQAAGAQQLHARLDSVMRVAERNGFSGVVRVERGGELLLEQGYGLANRATKTPFTPATIVQIGSNTKDFTAVAILQLVERGRITLDDSIGKFFPSAPADKRAITVRQLMNHRAGFPLGVGGDFQAVSREQLVENAMRTPLLFAPGSKESYSNTGFSLLAAIIEQVTGQTYDQYLEDAILSKVGLTHTGFLLPKFPLNTLAHGYLVAGTDAGTMLEKPHAADGPYWNLRGNGGMLSTVGDMHAFYAVLFGSEKLLTARTRNPRFDPNEPIGLAGSDGVNFFLYDRFPGMATELIIASTNAAMKAPAIRRELGRVLGLPDPEGGAGPVARRPGGKPVPDAMATVINGLIASINAGDTGALRTYIAAHFTAAADDPTVDERLQRISRLHEALGNIIVKSIETFADGSVEAQLDSATEGVTVLRLNIDATSPYRIHGLQVRVGG
jgi:CubicO group peptidase (beta-lactamase class C family)